MENADAIWHQRTKQLVNVVSEGAGRRVLTKATGDRDTSVACHQITKVLGKIASFMKECLLSLVMKHKRVNIIIDC